MGRYFLNSVIVSVSTTLVALYQATIVPVFSVWSDRPAQAGYRAIVGAFGVFMMTQFFQTLPKEMREAAIVDGAGEFRIFTRIYLPLARPAVATLALFMFMDSWDQLLWPNASNVEHPC